MSNSHLNGIRAACRSRSAEGPADAKRGERWAGSKDNVGVIGSSLHPSALGQALLGATRTKLSRTALKKRLF